MSKCGKFLRNHMQAGPEHFPVSKRWNVRSEYLISPPVDERKQLCTVSSEAPGKQMTYNRLLSVVHIAIDLSKQYKYSTTTYL